MVDPIRKSLEDRLRVQGVDPKALEEALKVYDDQGYFKFPGGDYYGEPKPKVKEKKPIP